jgi:hypothetical protein
MIRAYTGIPGSGKTSSMVYDAVQHVRKTGAVVFTNMSRLRFPEAIYLGEIDQIVEISNGLLLLDEAGVALSSRFWQTVDREVLQSLAQVRKNGLDLWYTVQHEARVDTVLRELSGEMIRCKRMWGRQWSYTVEPSSKLTLKKRVIKIPTWVYDLYDTFETIDNSGAGGGIGGASLAIATRRTLASRESPTASMPRKKPLPLWRWYGTMGRLNREAKKAKAYLESQGALPSGSSWYEAVRAEIRRERWLSRFALTPEQVPLEITPESPFSPNYTPEEVKARLIEQRLIDAENAAEQGKRIRKR